MTTDCAKQKNQSYTFWRCSPGFARRGCAQDCVWLGGYYLAFCTLIFFIISSTRKRDKSWWELGEVGTGEWRWRWRCRGWSCTGQEYLYIYIYNSETPSWLQSSDEEPVRCYGMTGCRGLVGRGGDIGFFSGVVLLSRRSSAAEKQKEKMLLVDVTHFVHVQLLPSIMQLKRDVRMCQTNLRKIEGGSFCIHVAAESTRKMLILIHVQ